MTITPTLEKSVQTANSIDVGPAGDDQYQPKIAALDDGRFIVFWTDNSDAGAGDTNGLDILAQIFDAFGNPIGGPQAVNDGWHLDDEANFSVAAAPGGKFVVAYEDADANGVSIRADEFTANADGSFAHNGSRSILSDPGADALSFPQVSVHPDGSYLVTYARTTQGSLMDVFGKIVDGGAIGNELSVILDSDDVAGSDHIASAVLKNGNYVVVSEYQEYPAGEVGLVMRIVNKLGAGVITAVGVGGTYGNGNTEFEPTVAALTGGGFVVSWSEYDGEDTDVLFETFDASGNSVSGLVGVDSAGVVQQNNEPTVVALSDGGFFIVYDHDETDSIRGKRFDAAGGAVGSTITIAQTAGTETEPTAALTSDGRIVVSWTEISGTNNDVKFAIYDPRVGDYKGSGSGDYITGRVDGLGPLGNFRMLGQGGDDTLIGRGGDDVANGSAGDDSLVGDAGKDSLDGGAGDDRLNGGAGNDSLTGGVGADNFVGGAGVDKLSFVKATGGVTLSLATGAGTGGDARGDAYSGIEIVSGSIHGDTIIGSSLVNDLRGGGGNDRLDGLGANDALVGGSGNDTLIGGVGADVMTGGGHNDRFEFSGNFGADRIMDFNEGADVRDVISLIGLGAAFDAFDEILVATTQVGADAVIDFGGGNTITLVGVDKANLHENDFIFG